MLKSLLLSTAIAFGSLQVQAQPPVYEIYALKYFGLHSVPVSEMALGASKQDTMNLFFMYWLVKGNNGKNILVDAGFLNDLDIFKTLNTTFYIRPDSVLLELNIKANEITDIILSHPHWDHADGISLFPNAHVWIQKEDYQLFCWSGLAEGWPAWRIL